ncbi:MAG: hypothetical protein Q9212_000899 [Teloschistes hypoglaucus]
MPDHIDHPILKYPLRIRLWCKIVLQFSLLADICSALGLKIAHIIAHLVLPWLFCHFVLKSELWEEQIVRWLLVIEVVEEEQDKEADYTITAPPIIRILDEPVNPIADRAKPQTLAHKPPQGLDPEQKPGHGLPEVSCALALLDIL